MSPSRTLGKEMKEIEGLANKLLILQIIDHEEDGTKIQQIFQRVAGAATLFSVRTIIMLLGYVCSRSSLPDGNGDQHPENGESNTA